MVDTKKRNASPEKVQISWRLPVKVLTALQHDADRQGFSTIPLYLNHLLSLHYFVKKVFAWNGEQIEIMDDRYKGVTIEKKMVNMRMLKRVVNALRADADQHGIYVSDLLRSMLIFHYFGDKVKQGDRES
jgi:hypothetical protein